MSRPSRHAFSYSADVLPVFLSNLLCLMHTRAVLLLVASLSLSSVASAQSPSRPTDVPGGMVFVAVGGASPQLSSLNQFLRAAQFPTFTSEVPTMGAGGYGMIGDHIMVGGEGHAYVWGTGQRGSQDVTIRGGALLATGGYAFYPFADRLPELRVFPRIGAGVGTVRLRISGSGDTFAGVIESPARGVTLARTSFLLSASAGAEYTFLRETRARFRLGLQVGYLASPTATDWQIGGASVFGGPDVSLQGPFVRLVLGRGW